MDGGAISACGGPPAVPTARAGTLPVDVSEPCAGDTMFAPPVTQPVAQAGDRKVGYTRVSSPLIAGAPSGDQWRPNATTKETAPWPAECDTQPKGRETSSARRAETTRSAAETETKPEGRGGPGADRVSPVWPASEAGAQPKLEKAGTGGPTSRGAWQSKSSLGWAWMLMCLSLVPMSMGLCTSRMPVLYNGHQAGIEHNVMPECLPQRPRLGQTRNGPCMVTCTARIRGIECTHIQPRRTATSIASLMSSDPAGAPAKTNGHIPEVQPRLVKAGGMHLSISASTELEQATPLWPFVVLEFVLLSVLSLRISHCSIENLERFFSNRNLVTRKGANKYEYFCKAIRSHQVAFQIASIYWLLRLYILERGFSIRLVQAASWTVLILVYMSYSGKPTRFNPGKTSNQNTATNSPPGISGNAALDQVRSAGKQMLQAMDAEARTKLLALNGLKDEPEEIGRAHV